MTSLCKTLKKLDKDELDAKLEEDIIKKSELQEKKALILLELDQENVTETQKQKLEHELEEIEKMLQNKQNEIDLIKVLSITKSIWSKCCPKKCKQKCIKQPPDRLLHQSLQINLK